MIWMIVYMVALILNYIMHCFIGYKADTVVYWLSGVCVCAAWIAGINTAWKWKETIDETTNN